MIKMVQILSVKKRPWYAKSPISIEDWQVKVLVDGETHTLNCWAGISPNQQSLQWAIEDKLNRRKSVKPDPESALIANATGTSFKADLR